LVNSHRVLHNKLAQYNTEIIQRRTGKEKKKETRIKASGILTQQEENPTKRNKTKKKNRPRGRES
jgi:hypothetical protein